MKKHAFLQLPWKTRNTLQQLYFKKKHRSLLIFWHASARNFLLVATDTTKTVRICDSSSSATRPTHVIWVQSCEVLHGAVTIHKTSKMTKVLSFLFITCTGPTNKRSKTLSIISLLLWILHCSWEAHIVFLVSYRGWGGGGGKITGPRKGGIKGATFPGKRNPF